MRVNDELTEPGTGITYYEFLIDGHVGPYNMTKLTEATAAIDELLDLSARTQEGEAVPTGQP